MSTYLTMEGFMKEFNKLSKIQKSLFLESAKKLQKISTLQIGVDKNCLAVFKVLFEAYSMFSTSLRKTFEAKMQENINATLA